jgi:hypothetical protein
MSLPEPLDVVELDELHPSKPIVANMNATASHRRFMRLPT